MLKIYQSNKISYLIKKICKKIKFNKKKNILINELFLIDNIYISKWIDINLANKNNISMNIKYITISKFFTNLIKKNQSNKNNLCSLFKQENLQWILMSIINDSKNHFFLNQEGLCYQNFEFCVHMAHIFKKYIFFRPDLICEWEKKKIISSKNIYNWQKKLWILIIKKLKCLKQKNFTEIINNFLKNIKKKIF